MGLLSKLFKSSTTSDEIVVIGLNESSAASIFQILQDYPKAKITVYEEQLTTNFKVDVPDFGHVDEYVEDKDIVVLSSKRMTDISDSIKINYGAKVERIDTKNNVVKGTVLGTGESFETKYNKLIYALPAQRSMPKIEGAQNNKRILNFQSQLDFTRLDSDLGRFENSARPYEDLKIAVIGNGYVLDELAVRSKKMGADVTYVSQLHSAVSTYDDQKFVELRLNLLRDNDIEVIVDKDIAKFDIKGTKVAMTLNDGALAEFDYVFIQTQLAPNVTLLKNEVALSPDNAIIADEYRQTSVDNVFAIGTSTVSKSNVAGGQYPLATQDNVIRQGEVAGLNIYEKVMPEIGTQASAGVNVFGTSFFRTGVTLRDAKKFGLDADEVTVSEYYRPEYMNSNEKVMVSLVYNQESHEIIGAQMMSGIDVSQSINAFSIAMQKKMTIEEFSFVDMLFQPHFDKPFNYLNMVAQASMSKVNNHWK
ncbi:hypothetical protein EQG49_06360 [Periweissella cryptocerci]|uniref:NADH oxidase n=1 Tax=Periweissella cryptocerci TaxID=2506420 RepID=A0A4V1AIN3_9LACO|nr:FAD-dependent oxidoreductase [Periweissella cryptocerci]QBO36105.1 hypothetical protein EQG49_06360 [Periweissella cryptocerci]